MPLFQCFISFSVDAQLICAFVFCTCKNATQFFGHRFDQFIFLYKDFLSIASSCSYTAKFVLDFFKIPKGKFYHDESK